MSRHRSYVVELESSELPRMATYAEFDTFADLLLADKRFLNALPFADADRRVLDLRITVSAAGPADALCLAEVAFVDAAARANLSVDVILADVWLDQHEGQDDALTIGGDVCIGEQ